MENLKLANGKFLNRVYGKYSPDLIFVSKEPLKDKPYYTNEAYENGEALKKYFDGKVSIVYGEYRVNKKGNHIFEINENGPHMLICVGWGGAFNKTRGDFLLPNEPEWLLYRRKSSNGGGTGNTFYVIDRNHKFEENLDEDNF